MTKPPCLSVENLSVAYGSKTVAQAISLTLEEGDIGCLLGPSGCGKTSLLRTIAGFEPAAAGKVRINGKTVSKPGHTVPPEDRNIGMVFQDFALFPHLTAANNIGFGLRTLSEVKRASRVQEMLHLMGLDAKANAYPHELSGGQQQRLAVARAMAPKPAILLMDEPFSAVDPDLREQLATEIRELLKRDHMTAILVTHDQMEAFAMADKIAVLSEGNLLQVGAAFDLYHRPATREVADFVGEGEMISGVINQAGQVETSLGTLFDADISGLEAGQRVDVLVRPDDLQVDPESPLQLEIIKKTFRGSVYRYTLRTTHGETVLCLTPSHHLAKVGDHLGIRVVMDHVNLFAG